MADPIELEPGAAPAVLAFVGPTGVGKTTTVAKIAAEQHLRQHRRAGLITTDVHRPAAHEQLRAYADIIDLPFRVADTPDQLVASIRELADCDMVLIDTAGVGPHQAQKMGELRAFLAAAGPREVHLLLSATTSPEILKRSVESFESLGVNRLIFTKLDEAVGFGVILNCLQLTRARLSYVTDGQRIPDDLRTGQRSRIADVIAGLDTAECGGRLDHATA